MGQGNSDLKKSKGHRKENLGTKARLAYCRTGSRVSSGSQLLRYPSALDLLIIAGVL